MVGTGANLMSVSSSLFLRSLEGRLIRDRKKQKLPAEGSQLRVAHHGKITDPGMRLQAQLSLLAPGAIRSHQDWLGHCATCIMSCLWW